MSFSIKALVVDDSNFMRRAIAMLLESDREIEVVGLARSGEEALSLIGKLAPDVVTLDVEMEGMDGVTTLGHIMERHPTPVIMFSAYTRAGAVTTIKALRMGAVDFVEKPSGSISMDLSRVRDDLIAKVKIAARSRLKRPLAAPPGRRARRAFDALRKPRQSILAVGSSTGGVQALQVLLASLPVDFSAPVLVVQHMPAQFTSSLAEDLDRSVPLKIFEARHGQDIESGGVYIAPGGIHTCVKKTSAAAPVRIHLTREPRSCFLRPSVDVMMSSVARVYGPNAVGLILTGMGGDGTEGMRCMKERGALTMAQDQATSVVYGMPRSAIEAGVVDNVLPLGEIGPEVARIFKAVNR